jgi:hypothetical protein
MAPVMAINRAVLIRPMAMVTRPDAEYPVHPTDRAAHRAAGDSTKWTGGGIALRRAALHSSNNALSMNHDRRGEQSRNRGKLQNFQHLCLQITQVVHSEGSFPVFSLEPVTERPSSFAPLQRRGVCRDRKTSAYGTTLGGAALRTGGNTLSLGRERRNEQSVTTAIPNLFCIVIPPCFPSNEGLNTGLRQKFPRLSEVQIRCFPTGG